MKNCSMLELQNVNGCIPSATKIGSYWATFQTLRNQLIEELKVVIYEEALAAAFNHELVT